MIQNFYRLYSIYSYHKILLYTICYSLFILYLVGCSSLSSQLSCLSPFPSPHSVQFSHSVVFDSLRPHELQHCQASLSITNSWSPPKPTSIESAMPSNHLILSSPSPLALNLSQHQGFFQVSQLFASGGQSIGVSASASVLPKNIQD